MRLRVRIRYHPMGFAAPMNFSECSPKSVSLLLLRQDGFSAHTAGEPIQNVEKLHTSAVLASRFARPDTETRAGGEAAGSAPRTCIYRVSQHSYKVNSCVWRLIYFLFFFANFADGRVCNLGQNEFIKVVSQSISFLPTCPLSKNHMRPHCCFPSFLNATTFSAHIPRHTIK